MILRLREASVITSILAKEGNKDETVKLKVYRDKREYIDIVKTTRYQKIQN